MKLYTVAIYDLEMCINEVIPDFKNPVKYYDKNSMLRSCQNVLLDCLFFGLLLRH